MKNKIKTLLPFVMNRFTPAADIASLPLDGISNITAAYSVRRLLTSYTDDLIRLRRDSDNAELDFGYDGNGDLDTAAITTWLAGANGFVATWYDQGLNGYDVANSTAVGQPQLIVGGPYILYDGSNDNLRNKPIPAIVQPVHVVCMCSIETYVLNRRLWDGGANEAMSMFQKDGVGALAIHSGTELTGLSASAEGVDMALSVLYNGASSEGRRNGSTETSGNAGTSDPGGIVLNSRGNALGEGSIPAHAKQYEFIIVGAILSAADHNQIGESMDDYFGITWTTVT